ncbi:MAG: zinc ribbon domain-containing protein, partial [Thermofilum sp.]
TINMKCPNCGSEVRETDNYCPNCGYPLKPEARRASPAPTVVVLVALAAAILLLLAFWALPAFFTPYWMPWHCPMCGWWPAYGAPRALPGLIASILLFALLALLLAVLLPYLLRKSR